MLRIAYLLLTLLALTLSAACVPIISHGPRVQTGLSGGVTGAVRLGSPFLVECHQSSTTDVTGAPLHTRECPPAPRVGLGPAHVAVRYGWSAPAGSHAYSVGLQVPGPVDLYAQLRGREGRMDRGVGLLLSPLQVSPYFQLGRTGEKSSWYSTQLLSVVNPFELEQDYVSPALQWVPSVSWQRSTPSSRRALTFHVLGHVGVERERHRQDGNRPLLPVWGLATGVSVDFWRSPTPP